MTSINHVPTLEELLKKVLDYYIDADVESIKKAYYFAQKAHEGQFRSSGQEYIIHPLSVACILADLKLDIPSVVTGLLHDTVEDTTVTLYQIEKEFGAQVAGLVDGVTKLRKIASQSKEEKQAENLRKMILAMSKDIRVILVKLADRLTNMRTLQYLAPEKQVLIAQETLDIYAPIANRLGISFIKMELEDLCLRYLNSEVYYNLKKKIAISKRDREMFIKKVCDILNEHVLDYSVEAKINGRAKHFYSIYSKMQRRCVDFEEIYDLIAFRIVVQTLSDCYKVLGIIHSAYKPIQGRFKDYIAIPKVNSYQSLHTTVIGPDGQRIEIQIRTQQMNELAEHGIAAHWMYKEGTARNDFLDSASWIERLLIWHEDVKDSKEFIETLKLDLFPEDVFVFTPKGAIKKLPYDSTSIDFAYLVHTDIGHCCIGSRINGRLVPLRTKLRSGDMVEIITSNIQNPSKDWLGFVKTSKARARIKHFLNTSETKKNADAGVVILSKALNAIGSSLSAVEQSGVLNSLLQVYHVKNLPALYVAIELGKIEIHDVLERIIPNDPSRPYQERKKIYKDYWKPISKGRFLEVSGLSNVAFRLSKCCYPVLGDLVVGFVTAHQYVAVHLKGCTKVHQYDLNRALVVHWVQNVPQSVQFEVKVRVLALEQDRCFERLSQMITQHYVTVKSASIRLQRDFKSIFLFHFLVHNTEQLAKLVENMRHDKNVLYAARIGDR